MIWSLIFAIVGTSLLWAILYFSTTDDIGLPVVMVIGSVTCSCGLMIAFRSLPDFYQVPRSSFTAKIFFILCCKSLLLKCPKAAGILFLFSSCYAFFVILAWTVVSLSASITDSTTKYQFSLQSCGWLSVAFTLLAGIFYRRAYGTLSCCCCSKGTGLKPGALQTSTMGEEEDLEVICVNDTGELVASP